MEHITGDRPALPMGSPFVDARAPALLRGLVPAPASATGEGGM